MRLEPKLDFPLGLEWVLSFFGLYILFMYVIIIEYD